MNNKKKKTYEVPQLETFVCKIEKGFAGSNPLDGFGGKRSGYGSATGDNQKTWN